MGLPLWQPKVESDIPSRPEAKNPGHARSRIRNTSARDRGTAIRERPAARNGELRSRERRRGLLQDLQERLIESNSNSGTRTQEQPPARGSDRHLRLQDSERNQQGPSAFTDSQPPRVTLDWPRPLAEAYGDGDDLRHFGDSPDTLREQLIALRRLEHETSFRRLERETGGRLAIGQNAERFARASERFPLTIAALEHTRLHNDNDTPASERTQRLRAQAAIFARLARNQAAANEASRPAAAAGVDGLGDRDRSLSPENDAAWDTLLTTVTPDPQPPSVGSSFASIASAVASRSSGNASSGTSLTGPDTGAEESAVEQPCDSDDEGDPVEFEVELGDDANTSSQSSGAQGNSYADAVRAGENNMPSIIRTRIPPVLSRRMPRQVRPYAYDGTGSGINAVNAAEPGAFRTPVDGTDPATDDLILQLVGGLGGMQHIVRSLVRREDIPNDWWVDAGLSRTLPRDDSTNDGSGNDSANNGSGNDPSNN